MKKTFGGGISQSPEFNNKPKINKDINENRAKIFEPLDKKISEYSPSALVSLLSERGVSLPENNVDGKKTIIINFCESDIGIKLNSLLALTFPKEIFCGARILTAIYGTSDVIFVFPSPYKKELDAIESIIPESEKTIICEYVDNKYPMFNSRCVISALFDKEYSSLIQDDKIPFIFISPEICLNVYEVLALGYSVEKYVSIGGGCSDSTVLARIIDGESINSLINSAEIKSDYKTIINGGLVKGTITDGNDAPNNCDGILLMGKTASRKTFSCIGCRKCDAVCPMKIAPSEIVISAEKRKKTAVSVSKACIGCKSCEYVCPSGIKISDIVRMNNSSEEKHD